MIKFSKISIKGSNRQNDLNALIDNDCCEEYQTLNKELIIEAEFGNTVIEHISLKISPSPEIDIQYKLFNLNQFDKECDIQKGKLIRDRYDDIYSIFTSFGHKQLVLNLYMKPYTHFQLIVKSEKFQVFKVFFIGLKGKRLYDEEEIIKQKQEEEAKQSIPKTPIFKPARTDQPPQVGLSNSLSFEDFINKVKSGKTVIPNSPNEKLTKIQEIEAKIPEQPMITLIIEDDNDSVQFVDNKVQKKFGLNLQKPFKSLFTNNTETQKQSSITKYFNKNNKSSQKYNTQTDFMIKFDVSEIDQGFMQTHKQLEISKGLAKKFRLSVRMYNELL